VVISSIEPTVTQAASYATISAMVIGAGYAVPTTGPNVSRFASIASQFGVTTTQLVSIVSALQGAAIDIDLAVGALTASANAATDTAGLVSALSTFMTAIDAVVATVNAAVPIPITAPGTPSIPGVDA
jgi:hypothetical protein